MMWSGGVEPDTIFQYPAQRDAILAAAATAAGDPRHGARLRRQPQLKLWLQPHLRAYYGIPPREGTALQYKAVRDALVNVARADPRYTWAPGCRARPSPTTTGTKCRRSAGCTGALGLPRGGRRNGPDDGALDGDLADAPPAWATMAPPSAPTVQWQPSEDVSVRWNPPQSGTGWFRVRNLHLGTGAVIDQLDTPSSQYLFTRAKQVATWLHDSGRVARYLRVRSGQRRRRTGAEHHAVQVLVGRLRRPAAFHSGSRPPVCGPACRGPAALSPPRWTARSKARGNEPRSRRRPAGRPGGAPVPRRGC